MRFSVIIPTYRRIPALQRCLAAIQRQNYEGEFEVVVVNDGGPPLEEHLEPFQDSLNLKLAFQSNSGPGKARNQGAELASGDRLIFLDDDCLPHPDWLENTRVAAESSPESMIGGLTVNSLGNNPYATASQLLVDFLYDYHNTAVGKGRFFTSNNFSLPTHAFKSLGGFDEGFESAAGEDREFCLRWMLDGREMLYDPNIVVEHAHEMDLRGFLKQHHQYGRAASTYWKRRRRATGQQHSLEPWEFYHGLLLYPWRRRGTSLRAVCETGLFLLAQLANAIGFFSAEYGRS